MNSQYLNTLYTKYKISSLAYGVVGDKIGDVYEEYIETIMKDSNNLNAFNNNSNITTLEFNIFYEILTTAGFSASDKIIKIDATTKVPPRQSGGNSKTDIIINIKLQNSQIKSIGISSKATYASKVAMAEFDVDTICKEVGINDSDVIRLMTKHQTDASANKFTNNEKILLRKKLAPKARDLVRWVVTASTIKNPSNPVFPTIIVRFSIQKPSSFPINLASGDCNYISHSILTTESYIDTIMLDAKGNIKPGGFGTGLGWTYATGSKGKKIQFKG